MKDNATTPDGPLGSRSMAALTLLGLLALLTGPLAAPAGGHAGGDEVTILASEDCPDRTYCYEVTNGDLSDVSGGDTLEITFGNPAENDLNHNLHVALLSDADVGGDTDASQAYANTTDIEPGETTNLTAQVPSGADGVYLWCTVGVHESQGMYREVTTGSDATGGDGDSTDGQNSSPGLGTAAGVLALAGVALALTRR